MRLELALFLAPVSSSAIFQFHKGAIRTSVLGSRDFVLFLFQFHKGAIRTRLDHRQSSLWVLHFNSIKVRLEHPDFAAQVLAHLFQFHKGAIRTSGSQASYYSQMRFQFHKGAIRTPFSS